MGSAINVNQFLCQSRVKRLREELAQAEEAASSFLGFVQQHSKASPDTSFLSISLCNYIPSLFREIDFRLNNYFRQSHGFLWYDWYRKAAEQDALINLWAALNKLHILLQGRFTAIADLIKCFIKQNMGQMSNW